MYLRKRGTSLIKEHGFPSASKSYGTNELANLFFLNLLKNAYIFFNMITFANCKNGTNCSYYWRALCGDFFIFDAWGRIFCDEIFRTNSMGATRRRPGIARKTTIITTCTTPPPWIAFPRRKEAMHLSKKRRVSSRTGRHPMWSDGPKFNNLSISYLAKKKRNTFSCLLKPLVEKDPKEWNILL